MPDNKPDKVDMTEKVLDMLAKCNPEKTGLGVLLGIVFYTISDNVIRLTKIALTLPALFWVAVGILSLNFRNLLFAQRTIDEELEKQMHYIEEVQKKGNFSEREKRQQWRNYISTIYKKASESMDNYNAGQSDKDKDRTATQ